MLRLSRVFYFNKYVEYLPLSLFISLFYLVFISPFRVLLSWLLLWNSNFSLRGTI